jgi:hypothetical protein
MENESIVYKFYELTKDKWFLYLYNCFSSKFNNIYNINEVEIRLNYLKKYQFDKLLYILRSNHYEFKENDVCFYTNIINNDTGIRRTIEQNKLTKCIIKKKGNIDYNFNNKTKKLKNHPYFFRISFANEQSIHLNNCNNENITKNTTKRMIERYSFIDSKNLFRYDLSKVCTKINRIKKTINYEFEIELLNGNLITAIKHMLVLSSYIHGYKISNYKRK